MVGITPLFLTRGLEHIRPLLPFTSPEFNIPSSLSEAFSSSGPRADSPLAAAEALVKAEAASLVEHDAVAYPSAFAKAAAAALRDISALRDEYKEASTGGGNEGTNKKKKKKKRKAAEAMAAAAASGETLQSFPCFLLWVEGNVYCFFLSGKHARFFLSIACLFWSFCLSPSEFLLSKSVVFVLAISFQFRLFSVLLVPPRKPVVYNCFYCVSAFS